MSLLEANKHDGDRRLRLSKPESFTTTIAQVSLIFSSSRIELDQKSLNLLQNHNKNEIVSLFGLHVHST